MNADQFNARHAVGTPVLAYPGARPEDFPKATRLVTRTRSRASVLGGHTDVVWVDGHSACIALSHVDVISEDEFAKARAEETAATVATEGAFPVPVGDEPQPLDDQQLAEALAAYEGHPDLGFACCTAHAVADHVPALMAEVQRLGERVARLEDDKVRLLDQQAKDDDEYVQATAERDRYRLAWRSARERAQAYGEGILRHVADRDTWKRWLKEAEARIAELEAERHTTNEALSDAAEQLRANRATVPTPTTPEEAS